jgi:hypothetical protein
MRVVMGLKSVQLLYRWADQFSNLNLQEGIPNGDQLAAEFLNQPVSQPVSLIHVQISYTCGRRQGQAVALDDPCHSRGSEQHPEPESPASGTI